MSIIFFSREYDDAIPDLSTWASENVDPSSGNRVMLTNPSKYLSGASYAVYEAMPEPREESVGFADSPVLASKSIKNSVEASGMVESHLRDAYACCAFFAELENDIVYNGATDWTEMSAAERCRNMGSICRVFIFSHRFFPSLPHVQALQTSIPAGLKPRRQLHHHRRLRQQRGHRALLSNGGDQRQRQRQRCLPG